MSQVSPPKTEVFSVASEPRASKSEFARVVGRLFRQPTAVLGIIWIIIVALAAIFAGVISPFDPLQTNYTPEGILQGPNAVHWLGTDDAGRDVLSRIIYGARVALLVGIGAVLVAMVIGVPLGLLLGYRGGWYDRVGTRFIDIMDALPGLLVAFAVIAILGRELYSIVLAVGAIFIMNFARMARAITLAERGKVYVDAAKVTGLTERSIIFRQILPNLLGPLVIQGAILTGAAIIIESMLSFVGIGLQSSTPSWGGLLGLAAGKIAIQPFLAIPPGVAIVLTVLAFNMLGDGVNDALAGEKRKKVKPAKRQQLDAAAAAATAAELEVGAVAAEVPALEVRGLDIVLNTPTAKRTLVSDVSLTVAKGEIVGLLGESGSGKSTLARAVLGLMQPGIGIGAGQILLDGVNIAGLGDKDMKGIRGSRMAAIFQDPMAALSPVHTIGKQLTDVIRTHEKMSKKAAYERAAELLTRVGVANAATRLKDYPHQFSGGMAQRVAIAIAIASNPDVIVADEATSALDVTTQAQVLDLLLDLRDEFGLSILFITHGLGVAAEACDRVVVLYRGEVVENSEVHQLFNAPEHPYTARLLAANPALRVEDEGAEPEDPADLPLEERLRRGMIPDGESHATDPHDAGATGTSDVGTPHSGGDSGVLLSVRDLALAYAAPSLFGTAKKRVVEGVSFDIAPGETLGLVGESGSGKSTIGRAVLRLLPVDEGIIEYEGTDISSFGHRTPLSYRRGVQAVFQDPSMSLNPKHPVSYSLTAALARHGVGDRTEREERVETAFGQVGLTMDHLRRYPSELSGGQQQRVAIARALVLRPKLVVCDEAVSALDLLTQQQIIELLAELQEETGMSYLFIAHDLGLVRNICDRIAVMRSGRMVELAETETLFHNPQHPYTKRLLGATPADHPEGREERRKVRTAFAKAHADGQVPVP